MFFDENRLDKNIAWIIMSLNTQAACRACLDTKSSEFVKISGRLREVYEQFTALIVEDEDMCPKHLCVACVTILESFFEFREQCHRSVAAWKVYSEVKITETKGVDVENEIKEENECAGDNFDLHVETDFGNPPDNADEENFHCNEKNNVLEIIYKEKGISGFVGHCEFCQRTFSYKNSLIKHVNKCNYLVKYSGSKKTNKDLSKPRLPYADALFCGICKESSSSLTEISKHLEAHQATNDLVCVICEYAASDFADLFGHRFSHQPTDVRPKRACFICSQVFLKVETLEFHFRGKHLNKMPGLCKVCHKGFNNYKHFLQHKKMHAGHVYTCDVCKKTFTFEKSLMNHMSTHTGMKTYMCHLCGFKSRQSSGLRSHHFRHHTEHQKIPCSHCGKSFKNSETLREHMARVTADRAFPCPFCQKAYRSEKELLNHTKWHSEEKPYTCNICGSSYKAKGHLKCHMRNHTGERPYVCKVCNMGFTSTNVLKRHTLTHTGEKAYACEYCDKRFAAKNNLKKHVSRHMSAANQNTLHSLLQQRSKTVLRI